MINNLTHFVKALKHIHQKFVYVEPIKFSFGTKKMEASLTQSFKRQQKKISRQLTVLKKQLASKQPVKSQNLYEKIHHKQVYQKIETEMQAFFYKRSYDLNNFNFLINLLIEQKKFDYIDEALAKMKMINIQPDEKTYNYLIKAAAVQGDAKKCEEMFEKASKLFLPSKYFYTSLIQVYLKSQNSEMASTIMRQMTEKGIIPDLPVYTAVINCHRIDRNLPKCWQLHKQVVESGKQIDETYVAVMMKVYAASHDTQKCIKLYKQNILKKNIKPMVETKNAYMKALAARKEYCNDAIDLFFKMYETGDFITQETVRWALKACSTGANLRSAIQILKIMKLCKIEPTKEIYNSLFRVYGKVCDLPEMQENYREVILIDTFKLLEEIQNKNMVDTTILNNILNVYTTSDQDEKVDGLILPLYEKFGLEYNPYTYEILMKMYVKKKDFNTAIRIWNQAKSFLQEKKEAKTVALSNPEFQKNHIAMKEGNRQTFNMMHMYLDIGIRMMDMRMVLDGLNMFKTLKRMPKNETLKMLGTIKNLPEEILISLMDFKIRFGNAKISKMNEGHKDDPQNK